MCIVTEAPGKFIERREVCACSDKNQRTVIEGPDDRFYLFLCDQCASVPVDKLPKVAVFLFLGEKDLLLI